MIICISIVYLLSVALVVALANTTVLFNTQHLVAYPKIICTRITLATRVRARRSKHLV